MIGIATAVENIDNVIKIIKNQKYRNSKKNLYHRNGKLKKYETYKLNRKEKNILSYQLSSEQVNAILELKLQKLTAFGIGEIESEINKLSNLIVEFNKIINSKKELYKLIVNELENIKDRFAKPRKQKL